MYRRFVDLTNAPPTVNKTQIVYPLSAEPLLGNLTIILWNDYTTVIPHHELISQERGTTSQGAYDVVNASALSVPICQPQRSDVTDPLRPLEIDTISVDNGQNTEITPVLGGVYILIGKLSPG